MLKKAQQATIERICEKVPDSDKYRCIPCNRRYGIDKVYCNTGSCHNHYKNHHANTGTQNVFQVIKLRRHWPLPEDAVYLPCFDDLSVPKIQVGGEDLGLEIVKDETSTFSEVNRCKEELSVELK